MQVKDAAWDGAYVDIIDQEIEHRCQVRAVVQKPPAPLLPVSPPFVQPPEISEPATAAEKVCVSLHCACSSYKIDLLGTSVQWLIAFSDWQTSAIETLHLFWENFPSSSFSEGVWYACWSMVVHRCSVEL